MLKIFVEENTFLFYEAFLENYTCSKNENERGASKESHFFSLVKSIRQHFFRLLYIVAITNIQETTKF